MNMLFKMLLKLLLLPIILVLILLVAVSKFVYTILGAIGMYLMMLFVFLGIVMIVMCKVDQSLGKEGWITAIFLLTLGFVVSPYGLPALLIVIGDKLEDLKDDLIDF